MLRQQAGSALVTSNVRPQHMPFDPKSLLDFSHLATFLRGAAVGAAGTYMADRFTDRRSAKEAEDAAGALFRRFFNQMPELFAEFRKDLGENSALMLRAFVILPSERSKFKHDKPRIEVYETKHPTVKNLIGVLVSEGLVEVVRSSDTPIYRLTESFFERLERAD
jgi:hypothetical protein